MKTTKNWVYYILKTLTTQKSKAQQLTSLSLEGFLIKSQWR